MLLFSDRAWFVWYAAPCVFYAFVSASFLNAPVEQGFDNFGVEDMYLIRRAHPFDRTVRVPAVDRLPSASQQCRSLVLIVRLSCISWGLEGKGSPSAIAFEMMAKAVVSLVGIPRVRLRSSKTKAFSAWMDAWIGFPVSPHCPPGRSKRCCRRLQSRSDQVDVGFVVFLA